MMFVLISENKRMLCCKDIEDRNEQEQEYL